MDKKKTICIIMGGHFSATIGGAQYQAKCIVDGLIETNRFNIYYLTRKYDPDYRPEGYTILKIANSSGIRKHGFIFDTRRLLSLLKQIRPDIIYQRGLKAYTGVIAYYAKNKSCKSVFHIAHDYDLLSHRMWGKSRLSWLRKLEKSVGDYGIRRVDSIVAQTQYQADLLLQRYARRADAVIPNFHPFPEENIDKDGENIRIMWVANFKSVKQPELFVRLAREFTHRQDVRFIMIGRPGSVSEYRKLHDEIEKLDNLEYMGEQPIEEVNMQLARAHIFVNTSRAEGFPNTFIQAWMRRVPTVSLEVDPDEILATEGIGYRTGSYQNLHDQVLTLIEDTDTRNEMGHRAQRYAFEMHSPRGVQKLIELME